MSIADKLKKLKEAKEAIKDAIIKKGVEVLDTDSFKSYADKIESIVAGGSDDTAEEGLTLQDTRGLCFWIDGQYNTREGLDHSVGYMENLMYNVPYTKTMAGNTEYFGGASTWNGDYLKLNTYAFYPQVASPTATLEMLFYIDEDVDTVSNGMWLMCNRPTGAGPGWSVQLSKSDGGKVFMVTGSDAAYHLPAREKNKLYYFVATFDSVNNWCTLAVLNTGEKVSFEHTTLGLKTNSNMGLGVVAQTSTSVTSANKNRWVGLNVGMARVWTRILSDEEIQRNYQEVKARFGF